MSTLGYTPKSKPRQLTCPACQNTLWSDSWHGGEINNTCLCLYCGAPLELREGDIVVNLRGTEVDKWQCPVCYRKSTPESPENEGWQCYCGTEVRPNADGFLEMVEDKKKQTQLPVPPPTPKERSPAEITGYGKRKRARDRAKRQQQK